MALPTGLGAWADLPFFETRWPEIDTALRQDRREILPPASQRFAALELTQPEDTRVVILGQDPYPTPGHAHGLAFSVEPDVTPLPRSLSNIFKELQSDAHSSRPNGDLRAWARQGVLLLNTALSVPAGDANGHKDLGWDQLVREVLERTSGRPTAYVFWGKQAQRLEKHLHPGDHLILKTAHPSPLSARRGFFGSRPFSAINTWLQERGHAPIDWAA
ncbi:uracil-DNA glycosylase [Phaeobacter sp. QD34_3]|uniref:uracil-DNA glycosylase n=1 Tax=unclassified Phaeobacter TaxID=2621772 RepID=UPI00237F387B|nr:MULTISPECIES: uracil-DNA glycosylase [unclassified Phaeobacter]MDE4131659.1 uracil-DNA glycosylase [Phaeobacter sp. QD34_3]MDE4135252.1 uracil-DNA glycosylase [Phaeobacter sp. QD34_24]